MNMKAQKNQEHLSELERTIVAVVMNDYRFLNGIEAFKRMTAKERVTVQLVRMSSFIALRHLPVPVTAENYQSFYNTTCLPIVDTVLSEVNEEMPINIEMAKELLYSAWLDRARIAVGAVPDSRIFDMFYQNPSHPEALKKLVGAIAEREAKCQ